MSLWTYGIKETKGKDAIIFALDYEKSPSGVQTFDVYEKRSGNTELVRHGTIRVETRLERMVDGLIDRLVCFALDPDVTGVFAYPKTEYFVSYPPSDTEKRHAFWGEHFTHLGKRWEKRLRRELGLVVFDSYIP